MSNNECTKCIHHPVCKTAESCDGYVSGCEHFVVISNLETTTKQKEGQTDVREKLVELIGQVQDCGCDVTDVVEMNYVENITLADHLIANGVTVQSDKDINVPNKWISVKDRLPEEEGLYLVAVVNDHERRYSKTAWYHGHGNWFLHQKVTHWMPLPQPPKGE